MEYEINYDTQIIMPIGDNSSKIIESEEEVRAALDAGASVVSTGEVSLWNLNLED